MTPTAIRYSQREEQDYILEAVKDLPSGRLLDIGAWDPFTFSNSRALIELGWEALLVEPSPAPMARLLEEYGQNDHVTLVQAIVTTDGGIQTLHVTADGVSTTEEAEYRKWMNTAKFTGQMLAPSIPIARLVEFALDLGKPFDFVSIDTEGTAVDLLKRMMHWYADTEHSTSPATSREYLLPACIAVEHNQRQDEIFFATRRKYETVYANEENLVLKRL